MQSHPPKDAPPAVNPYAAPAHAQHGSPPHAEPLGGIPPRRRWLPRISLLLIALGAGVLWRAELELTTGWASLDWIPRFHWAIPIGLLAFILWVLGVTHVSRPWAFAAALLVYAILGYIVVEDRLKFTFGRYLLLFDDEEYSGMKRMALWKLISFCLVSLVPATFSLLSCGFGVPVRLGPVILSTILFLFSWGIAGYAFYYFEHRGDPGDPIHALKSGYVIPLLILSLGFPILRARSAKPPFK